MVKMVDQNSPWYGRFGGSMFGFQAVLSGLNQPLPIQIGHNSGRPCRCRACATMPRGEHQALTLSCAHSRSPSISRSRIAPKQRRPRRATIELSLAELATHVTPLPISLHPQLCHDLLHLIYLVTSQIIHK